MKYPLSTTSKPVVGREAKALLEAIEAGTCLANEAALATAQRIAQQRKKKLNTNGEGREIRRD